MSFLDETEDRPSRSGSRRPPPRRPSSTDKQTLLVRRIVGIGGAVILLFLLVLLVKSCRSAQKEQAFKDYNRDVGALIQESDDESKSLFTLLENGGSSAVDTQSQVNGYAQEAAQLVSRAKGTDHPGELDTAHRYLVESLQFRSDGLRGVADQLPAALGNHGEEASKAIAGYMQYFLTSDVIYNQRFKPRMSEALKKEGLTGEHPPNSQFITDIAWLDPTVVQDRIGRIGSGGSTGSTGTVAPGLHGTGLGTVTYQPGGVTLNAGGGNQLKIGAQPVVRRPGDEPGRERREERQGQRHDQGRPEADLLERDAADDRGGAVEDRVDTRVLDAAGRAARDDPDHDRQGAGREEDRQQPRHVQRGLLEITSSAAHPAGANRAGSGLAGAKVPFLQVAALLS